MSKTDGQAFTKEEFYLRIGMTEDMEKIVSSKELQEEEYKRYRKLFNTNLASFFGEVKKQNNYRQLFLKLYLEFSYEAYGRYEERGIPENIYFDTFRDIVYWTENCIRDYGETGIEEYEWIWRHVKLKLFKLGRLQYEIIKGKEEPELNGRKLESGEIALNLHIPQGESLDLKNCIESLRKAAEFFGAYHYKEITCHSWLLSPAIKQLLPKTSNILQFQSLFDIYALDGCSREAEERVFCRLEDKAENYPEKTGLQRALKKFILEGGSAGSAFGIVKEGL